MSGEKGNKEAKMTQVEKVEAGLGERLISILDMLSLKFYGDSRPRALADSRIYKLQTRERDVGQTKR